MERLELPCVQAKQGEAKTKLKNNAIIFLKIVATGAMLVVC